MEHSPKNESSAKENVLARIREKNISMRPKLYFTSQVALAGLVALTILVVSIAIVSFILFGLRVNGHEALLSFGLRGVSAFLLVLPWPLLVLDILLVIFLERLLRRFKFGYRSPILYLMVGLVGVAVVSGLLLDRGTPMNDALLHRAEHGGLPPPFGELYEHARVPAPHDRGIYRGTILEIATTSLRLQHDDLDNDHDDTGYLVLLPPGFDIRPLFIGEKVYVAGDKEGDAIRAFGVQPLRTKTEIRSVIHP